jgi:hypothetical protein
MTDRNTSNDHPSSRGLRRVIAGALVLTMTAALAACLNTRTQKADSTPPPPGSVWDAHLDNPQPISELMGQSVADADAKSRGCLVCHEGIEKAHASQTVQLGCVDCHGGDPNAEKIEDAHVLSGDWERDSRSRTPPSESAEWLQLSWDYVRFVNPGDLRVAESTCGPCHPNETYNTKKSMMAHSGFLYGAALYNNGSFPLKRPQFGLSYAEDGTAVRVQTIPPPTDYEVKYKGVLAYLDPIPRYNITQMGNILRVFEKGGRRPLELGNPDREEEAGLPARRFSQRGLGTLLRTDPVYLAAMKTRLVDPILWKPGTTDNPGDYRHSGCTACHVVYANDRDPEHSAQYAKYGNTGYYHGGDKSIPREESGHPITHQMTRAIPSSQCMVCHIHPGTNMEMTYYGDIWYDNESDGDKLYPDVIPELTWEEMHEIQQRNPEGSALRGKWGDPDFLREISTLNPEFEHVQLSDYHGHGWLYRKVFLKDRKGNMLDAEGNIIDPKDPEKWEKAVHLKDIHLEVGMHCVDCHFTQDVHGNGKLYQEPRAATEIMCIDCHGSTQQRATLITSGPAGGNDLALSRTPFGKRFFWRRGKLYQRSQLDADVLWVVNQVIDSIDPEMEGQSYELPDRDPRPIYNAKARYAKTIQKDGRTWGDASDPSMLAHQDERMQCQSCHTAWTTACFGCHLPMKANYKKPIRHYEGGESRNWTQYNYQVLRDAAYMLGIDGTVTGNKISPVRSACAIVVGSQNQNREWIYSQQQTVSAEGYSGQAFSTYVPHTVRTKETKACEDCHVSDQNDNNAWMAQVLLHGTNYTNFMGRFCYVGAGEAGLYAIVVTERDEPQAVYGSTLHRDAFPERYRRFVEEDGRILKESYHHGGTDTRSIQHRGEYLYAAEGTGGVWLYDIANIDHKGFSERITTSVISPLGQKFFARGGDARSLASPTTLGVDPTRPQRPENEEQPVHPLYAFVYVADAVRGLEMVLGATLLDGDPANNFIDTIHIFNPDGLLDGADYVYVAGNQCWVSCDKGLVLLDLQDIELGNPVPRVVKVWEDLQDVTCIQVQFRFAFLTDSEGVKVIDITNLDDAALIPEASLDIGPCNDIYLARTYAYVSALDKGLAILDIEKPHEPKVHEMFTADGQLNDVRMARVAMTNASLFCYVADGVNGLRVLQLTSPETVPEYGGFSPAPKPVLIATYPTPAPAKSLEKPLDRDRAVDEGGNQLAVFGRIGSRPFNLQEQRRMYIRDGKLYKVSNKAKTKPISNNRVNNK